MLIFAWSQVITYLFWVNPGSDLSRALLAFCLLSCFCKKPLLSSLAVVWQSFCLLPAFFTFHWDFRPLLQLRCDETFWFICTSGEGDFFVKILAQTKLLSLAMDLRDFVELRTQAWDGLWGPLAFSLLMGGEVDKDIKGLYRNLGFLHVLVVSGSQFTLLSRFIENFIIKPFNLLYALTLLRWRSYRTLKFSFDLVLQIFLMVYLLASGATAPCQRAFLVSFIEILTRWYLPPRIIVKTEHIFISQMIFFPSSWFSLSNFLSWGAVYCLKLYREKRTFLNQLRTSSAIQCLNFLLFRRISLSALALDFFLAPLWDFLLYAALLAIFVQELRLGPLLSEILNLVHDFLGKIEGWQVEYLGSAAITLRSLP